VLALADAGFKDESKRQDAPKLRVSDTFLGAALLIVASASAITVLAVPRPVPPHELPSLVLSETLVRNVVRTDEADAARVPSDVHARALISLIHAQGEAEASPGESPEDAARRESNLRAVVNDVRASSGEAGLKALRALAVGELVRALERHENDLESDRVLGSFPIIMERYGLTVEGRLRAPIFVVRTLYKARWNSICRLAPTYALTSVEERAFYGWLALSAHNAPMGERAAALQNYRKHGGVRGEEALAGLMFASQHFDRAEELFQHAYARTQNVRLRNHALASSVVP
jgi:hypothetical protein